jgi:hypothetical protein
LKRYDFFAVFGKNEPSAAECLNLRFIAHRIGVITQHFKPFTLGGVKRIHDILKR